MCGRYSLHNHKMHEWARFLAELGHDFPPVYKTFPGKLSLPFIVVNEDGEREFRVGRFGLIKPKGNPKSYPAYHNARNDSLTNPKSKGFWVFRSSIPRRCLVPLSGFYEWPAGNKETPYYFRSPDREFMFAAGLWRKWVDGEDSMYSFTIVTTDPHPVVKGIGHLRSPALLTQDEESIWTSDNKDAALELLSTPYSGELETWRVHRNRMAPKFPDSPDCMEPLGDVD